MQAKATPIREAVVVIKDTTTMEELKDLSKRLCNRFGIEVFQIAIHRDEGYKKSKDGIKLNLHAHLVADWTDHETGKSLKLNRNDMSEMQTLVAECLKMERGKSSEKQHLSAIQFKNKAEEEKLRRLQEERERQEAQQKQVKGELEQLNTAKARKEAAIEASKSVFEGVKGVFGQSSKDKEIKSLKTQISSLTAQVSKLETRAESDRKAFEEAIKEKNRRISEMASLPQDVQRTSDMLWNFIYSIWDGAKEAIDVLCKYLYLKHINVSFSHEETAAINNALKNAQGIEGRKAYGKQLVDLAHAVYPGYADNSTRLWEISRKVEEVAKWENRWLQNQAQNRNQGRGY